jgi:hypothetical protein
LGLWLIRRVRSSQQKLHRRKRRKHLHQWYPDNSWSSENGLQVNAFFESQEFKTPQV